MTFPVVWQLGPFDLPAHNLFELIAYALGFRLYLRARRRDAPLTLPESAGIVAGCLIGALLGSKMLAFAEVTGRPWPQALTFQALASGKTIVGGLLGGWIGVEIAKKWLGVTRSTGDAFVLPLCLGIAIGRIGCFLAGLDDLTYGLPSTLPWSVDFGDGVLRHPTQLYEIAFLALFGLGLHGAARRAWPSGALFRAFLAGYLLWRFGVDFLKPRPIELAAGLAPIQVACLIGAVAAWATLARLSSESRTGSS